MTGCAAILLGKNAKTLHSWAGIGLGKETGSALLAKIKKSSRSKKNWLIIDTLIIDEVSMMSPDLLDKLDYIAQYLGVGKKLETGGLDLWKKVCLEKDETALEHMVALIQRCGLFGQPRLF